MVSRDRSSAGRLVLAAACALAACSKSAPPLGGNGDPCLNAADCGAGLICRGGGCAFDARSRCDTGKKRCNGDMPERCNDNGDGWSALEGQVACRTGCQDGSCLPALCIPFERTCGVDDAGNPTGLVEGCNSTGTGLTDLELCSTKCTEPAADPGVGHAAYCEAPIADCPLPFTARCKDGSAGWVQVCNRTQTAWDDRPCTAPAWKPSTHYDTGAFATRVGNVYRCISDGTSSADPTAGPGTDTTEGRTPYDHDIVDGGLDAGARWAYAGPQGDICVAGQCRRKVCSPRAGARPADTRCNGSVREICSDDGSQWLTAEVCSDGCDPATARCDVLACSPWSRKCAAGDASQLGTCNVRGTAFDYQPCPAGTTCATSDPAGMNASCREVRCNVVSRAGAVVAREERCNGSVREQCNAARTGWEPAAEGTTICQYGCEAPSSQVARTAGDGTGTVGVAPAGTVLPLSRTPLLVQFVTAGGAVDGATDSATFKVSSDGGTTWTAPFRAGATVVVYADVRLSFSGTFAAADAFALTVHSTCRAPACTAAAGSAPGDTRCNGSALEACRPDRTGYGFVQYCAAGCSQGSGGASCNPLACTPLARRCDAASSTRVEVCRADGSGWDGLMSCGQWCVEGACFSYDAACTPGAERCQGTVAETCVRLANNATEWRFREQCLTECRAGRCAGEAGACGCGTTILHASGDGQGTVALSPAGSLLPAGTTRLAIRPVFPAACTGVTCRTDSNTPCCPTGTVKFVFSTDGGTTWSAESTTGPAVSILQGAATLSFGGTFTTADLFTVASGPRTDAACTSMPYSVPTVQPVQLHTFLPTKDTLAAASPPLACGNVPPQQPCWLTCDGMSTLLVYTDPITDSAGVPVPDGTLVTFTNDAGNLFVSSPPAAPTARALQRPTLRGRARVLLRAPSACQVGDVVHVAATIGDAECGGVISVPLAPPPSTSMMARWFVTVSEDFSTTRLKDALNTTAEWDTARGIVSGVPVYDPGTGADGDFPPTAPVTGSFGNWDLRTLGLARTWIVNAMGPSDVSVDDVAPQLSVGDEVLLVAVAETMTGTGAYQGTYEFRKVAGVHTGHVTFTEPIVKRAFFGTPVGAGGSVHVRMQRVPQFRNVTVPPGWSIGTPVLEGYEARVATTANVALSTPRTGFPTIDGVAVARDDIVLVVRQDYAPQNGLYRVAAIPADNTPTPWTRLKDDAGRDVVAPGLIVYAAQGAVGGGRYFALVGNAPVTIGITSVSFTPPLNMEGLMAYNAGTGITAFRATGTVSLATATTLDGGMLGGDGLGLPPTIEQKAATWDRLDRLLLGGGTTEGSGGGVVFVHAKEVRIGDGGIVAATGVVDGEGGTIWISAGTLNLTGTAGAPPLRFQANGGRVRFDYGVLRLNQGAVLASVSDPLPYVAEDRADGYFQAQSSIVATPNHIWSARVLGMLGGACATAVGMPSLPEFSNIGLRLARACLPADPQHPEGLEPGCPAGEFRWSSDDARVSPSMSFPSLSLPQMKYRVELSPLNACVQEALGFTIRLETSSQ